MPLRFSASSASAHFASASLGWCRACGDARGPLVSRVIDLGPSLRALAEREGSTRVGRPMHIGRLGSAAERKFVIETSSSKANGIGVITACASMCLAWEAMFHREVLVDSIEMTDWHMVIEQWAGGVHSFPKFNMGGSGGPRRFVTTMQYVRTRKGTVTFDDHGAPWGAVARNLDITVTKFAGYRGEATFHGGTVWVQKYVPMDMSMKAVFSVDGGNVHFEQMVLNTDGAQSLITGDADIPKWPEMKYQVKSTVDFKRMRSSSRTRELPALGEGGSTASFILQGRPSPDRRFRERRGRPADRGPITIPD